MPEQLILRPYQAEAVERVRAEYRAGKRSVMLYASTGAGKAVIAAYLLQAARAKMTRAAIVVDRISLVDQLSQTLDTYGVDHGVLQSGHWRFRPYEYIQVCSAQTLEARGSFPDLSLLICDEGHIVRKSVAKLIQNMKSLKVLGLSASPFTKGLSTLYDSVVSARTTDELIAEGFLVPARFMCAVTPDMAGVKLVNGEWDAAEAGKRGMEIVGDVVTEWRSRTAEVFGGPVQTICFSASVDHGRELCGRFASMGYRFEQISYQNDSEDNRALIAEFRKPDTDIVGLVSVDALTRGFDVPQVACMIDARPLRKSFSTHIQKIGRVMRPAPGKTFALVLDHAGNIMRFWEDQQRLFSEGVTSLSDSDLDSRARKDPTKDEMAQRRCQQCGFALPEKVARCPSCGFERQRKSEIEVVDGVMVAVGGSIVPATGKYEWLADRKSVWCQLLAVAHERHPEDEARRMKFALAKYRSIYSAWPGPGMAALPPAAAVNTSLRKELKRQQIAWARARQSARSDSDLAPMEREAA